VTALGFATLAQLEVWASLGDLAAPRDPGSSQWLSSVLMLGVLALAVRRTRLLLATVVVCAVMVVDTLLVSHTTGFFGEYLPLLVLGYTAAVQLDARRKLQPDAIVALAFLDATLELPALHRPHDLLLNGFALLCALGIGRLIRRQTLRSDALASHTEQLSRQQAEYAQEVLEIERLRIARELHDVIAHSVSLIAVQAGAAEQVLERDPERAREPLQAIQTTARETIDELRRLLGVLRAADRWAGLTPQPGIAALPLLADQVRAAGLDVAISGADAMPPLTTGIELTVYRVVQEALTNSLKHGGATSAEVRLEHRAGVLTARVRDNGRGLTPALGAGHALGPGHGLIGMRERVGLYGGTVATAQLGDGGYHVTMQIPTRQAPLEGGAG
jgi:signal transduction histidine kinase